MMFNARVKTITLNMLPFADAASDGLPLGALLRLSLFQISVGMARLSAAWYTKPSDDRRAVFTRNHRRYDDRNPRSDSAVPRPF